MRAFVELLNRILALLESALRRRENQRHQDEAKQIESDPATGLLIILTGCQTSAPQMMPTRPVLTPMQKELTAGCVSTAMMLRRWGLYFGAGAVTEPVNVHAVAPLRTLLPRAIRHRDKRAHHTAPASVPPCRAYQECPQHPPRSSERAPDGAARPAARRGRGTVRWLRATSTECLQRRYRRPVRL